MYKIQVYGVLQIIRMTVVFGWHLFPVFNISQ